MIMDVKISTLDNGVRVATASMPHVESVAMGVWAGVGARFEPKEIGGISHFIEHMLFKGTRTRTAREISNAVEGRGGYLNAFTQEEVTCYYAQIAVDRFPQTLEILTDMYRNPRLATVDLEKERGVIIEEIMMYRDQPQDRVQDLLGEAMWPGHPLGRPIVGVPETVKAITRHHMQEYRAASYVPCNTVFTLAGKLDHTRCVEHIGALVASMGHGRTPAFSPAPASPPRRRVSVQAKDIEQAHVAIGLRVPFGGDDPRRYALRVLSVVLGENMCSRLFQIVREKHGLAYYVSSSAHLLKDAGGLVISAGLDRARRRKALDLVGRELRRLKDTPVPPAELRRAKDYVLGQTRLGVESSRFQMQWLGDTILGRGGYIPLEEAIQGMESVTAEELQSMARLVATSGRATLAMVAPGISPAEETYLGDWVDGL